MSLGQAVALFLIIGLGLLIVGLIFASRLRHRGRTPQRVKLVEAMPIEFITPEYIATENNTEVRNALIRRFGMENYLRSLKTTIRAKDEWGTLYEYRPTIFGSNGNIMMVKVLNSTPEPDGTFKDYFLRVPPHGARQPERWCAICGRNITEEINTPKQAIAWTFSLCPTHYQPQLVS